MWTPAWRCWRPPNVEASTPESTQETPGMSDEMELWYDQIRKDKRAKELKRLELRDQGKEEDTVSKCMEVFQLFAGQDNMLDKSELHNLMSLVCKTKQQEKGITELTNKVFAAIDRDCDKKISQREFKEFFDEKPLQQDKEPRKERENFQLVLELALLHLQTQIDTWKKEENFRVSRALTSAAYTLRGHAGLHEYLAQLYGFRHQCLLVPTIICTTLTTLLSAMQLGYVHHHIISGNIAAAHEAQLSSAIPFPWLSVACAGLETILLAIMKKSKVGIVAQAFQTSTSRLNKAITQLDIQLLKIKACNVNDQDGQQIFHATEQKVKDILLSNPYANTDNKRSLRYLYTKQSYLARICQWIRARGWAWSGHREDPHLHFEHWMIEGKTQMQLLKFANIMTKENPGKKCKYTEHQQVTQRSVLEALQTNLEGTVRKYRLSRNRYKRQANLVGVPALACGFISSIILVLLQILSLDDHALWIAYLVVMLLSAMNVFLLNISSELHLEARADSFRVAKIRAEKIKILVDEAIRQKEVMLNFHMENHLEMLRVEWDELDELTAGFIAPRKVTRDKTVHAKTTTYEDKLWQITSGAEYRDMAVWDALKGQAAKKTIADHEALSHLQPWQKHKKESAFLNYRRHKHGYKSDTDMEEPWQKHQKESMEEPWQKHKKESAVLNYRRHKHGYKSDTDMEVAADKRVLV